MEASSSSGCWLPGAARLGLAGQCALLALVTLVAYLISAIVAYSLSGADGCLAAAVAATLALMGSEMALLATRLGEGPSGAMRGLALGMMLRLGVPLAGSLVIRMRGGQVFEAGALYYLVAFYLITLATEIGFEVCRVPTVFSYRRRSQG